MKGKIQSRWTIIAPVGLVLLVILAVAMYQNKAIQFGTQESLQIVSDSTAEQVKLFNAVLDGRYAVLETFSSSLRYQSEWDSEEIVRRMAAIADTMDFSVMGFTDLQGNATLHNGHTINVADRLYFAQAIKGKRALERVDEGKVIHAPRFIISVPFYKGDNIGGVLYASFTPEGFQNLLVPAMFEQKGHAFIADKTGRVILSSKSLESMGLHEGMELLPQGVDFVDSTGGKRLASDLKTGTGGEMCYNGDGGVWYGVYQPLYMNDWMLFTVVPEAAVQKRLEAYKNSGFMAIIAVGASSVLLIGFVMLLDRGRLRQLEHEKQALKASRRALQANQKLYRAVEELSDSVLFEGNLRTGDLWFNPSYDRVYGKRPDIHTIEGLLQPSDVVFPEDMPIYNTIGEQILAGIPTGSAEYRVRKGADALVWHRMEYKLIYDSEGEAYSVVGKISSVDEHKRREEQLTQLATRDGMTGLLQHEATLETVRLFLAGEGAGGYHALYVFDLDNFKQANDTFGHQVGDQVIIAAAGELRSSFRASDIVGRIGGDEFMVLQKNVPSDKLAWLKAGELCERLRFEQKNGDENVQVTCCVGISVYEGDGKSFAALFREADSALYAAKKRGKHTFVVHGDEYAYAQAPADVADVLDAGQKSHTPKGKCDNCSKRNSDTP